MVGDTLIENAAPFPYCNRFVILIKNEISLVFPGLERKENNRKGKMNQAEAIEIRGGNWEKYGKKKKNLG